MTERDDCFVCRKHRGEEPVPGGPIYEDDLVYASHQAVPAGGREYPGYCFVHLRRPAPGLADLTDAEAEAIGRLVACLSRALKAELHAENVYAFVVGDRVPHLHIHLISRHPGALQTYWGVRVDEWPDTPRGDRAEVAALVNRLRLRLHTEMAG